MLYTFPEDALGPSAEPPRLPLAPTSLRRTRKKRSPAPSTRLPEAPVPAQFPVISQPAPAHAYSEPFLPAKYEGTLEYDAALEPGEYAFGSMRFPDIPLEFDPALLKVDMSFSNGNAVAPGMARQLEGFRSASPLSSDNSPMSMTLSLSSGTSSDGGHVETHDQTGIFSGDPETRTHHL
jgi:hypothetical protein